MATQFIRGLSWPVDAQMVNATTGAAFAGSVSAYITKDGVPPQTLGTTGGGAAISLGNGLFSYTLTALETDAALVAVTFVGASAVPVTIQVATVTQAQALVLSGATNVGGSLTLAQIRNLARGFLQETLGLTVPGSPLVSVFGTPGTTTVTYKIVATNNAGHSPASQGTTITTAPATLSGTNFVQLNWQAVPGASGYLVYRTATNGTSPTTTGLVGTIVAPTVTFNDSGIAGDSAVAPTTNTSGITQPFWTEQELLDIITRGCKDLWRGIVDLHQGHFTAIDETNVSLAANATQLTGVPNDCFRVLMIEPRSLSSTATGAAVEFRPKQYHSQTFKSARSMSVNTSDQQGTIFYDILNAGSPVTAPTIVTAPMISAALLLRLTYVRVLWTLVETDSNPIPGESDNALVAWTVAWALAKQRSDQTPDPGWLAIYATDKQALMTACTPRQEQEEEIVEGLFEGCS